MAVIVKCWNPRALIKRMFAEIAEGASSDWETYHGEAITLRAHYLSRLGWFTADIKDGYVTFAFVASEKCELDTETYSRYHSQLVITLLDRFDDLWELASVSSAPLDLDAAGFSAKPRIGTIN
jgi:hypothetical protein